VVGRAGRAQAAVCTAGAAHPLHTLLGGHTVRVFAAGGSRSGALAGREALASRTVGVGATARTGVAATRPGVRHFARTFARTACEKGQHPDEAPTPQPRENNQENQERRLTARADLAARGRIGGGRCTAVGVRGLRQRTGRTQIGEDGRRARIGIDAGIGRDGRRVRGIPEALGAPLTNLAALPGGTGDVGARIGAALPLGARGSGRAGHLGAWIPFTLAIAAPLAFRALDAPTWIGHAGAIHARLSQGTRHFGARSDAPPQSAELVDPTVDFGTGIRITQPVEAPLAIGAAAVGAVVGAADARDADLAARTLHPGAGILAGTRGRRADLSGGAGGELARQ